MEGYFAYLNALRLAELGLTLDQWGEWFDEREVLEIGSGSGIQLDRLRERCRRVQGVDLSGSLYEAHRSNDIVEYDGRILPFADASFDLLYSSNVLEHVQDAPVLHAEMQRVLRPGGVGIHVVPTHCWRLWSHFTHYPALPKKIARHLTSPRRASGGHSARSSGWPSLLANVLVDPRHGEYGNRFSEVVELHPSRWRGRLSRWGWSIINEGPTGIFYTGGGLLAGTWGFASRTRWASRLGSACHTFVVAPRDAS